MMMLNNLAQPAKIFVYLSVLSVIMYVVQSSGGGFGAGLIRTLVNKFIMIAIWAYLLNMVARSGGIGVGVSWALGLMPFMPSGLQFFF
jgi:hypothetical protein